MIQRLFLDRVYAKTRGTSIRCEQHFITHALAHEARAALALVQPAIARAQIALHAPVVEQMPPACGIGLRIHRGYAGGVSLNWVTV